MTYERKYLTACAAVAAGEALAIAAAGYCELWPLTAAIAVLTALFGFGYALPGWKICTIAVASLTVAFAASCGGHQLFREKFWMKDGVRLPPRINRSSSSADILRAELSRRAGIGLEHSPGAAALNRAILLGERRRLSRSTRQTFIDAGTMHIFAISGLHVMVIALTLRALAKMFFIPLRLAGALSLPVLWLYVFIVGIPPSAVRAAIMASIHFSSALFLRRPHAVVSWSLTFLIVHLHSPALIRDAGCLLSFSITLAIILAARHIASGGGIISVITVSAAAWIAGTPISAHFFGRITPGGLLANLFLMPMASANVVFGVLGMLASFLSEWLSRHLNNISAMIAAAMEGLSVAVASLPCANWEIENWTAADCLLFYICAGALICAVRRMKSRRTWLSRCRAQDGLERSYFSRPRTNSQQVKGTVST